MPLELQPCTIDDMPHFAAVEKLAYGDNKFTPILFPGPFPPSAADGRVQEVIDGIRDDPTTVWLKIVDTNDTTSSPANNGIAFARWHIYKDVSPGPRATRAFGEGCNVPACEAIFHGLRDQRARVLGDTKCVYLAVLATDPAHQRRGAASLLLQWGVDKAKELGLPLYLESSDSGHELYKKFGFEDIETQSIDMSLYGGEGFHTVHAMMAKQKPFDG